MGTQTFYILKNSKVPFNIQSNWRKIKTWIQTGFKENRFPELEFETLHEQIC